MATMAAASPTFYPACRRLLSAHEGLTRMVYAVHDAAEQRADCAVRHHRNRLRLHAHMWMYRRMKASPRLNAALAEAARADAALLLEAASKEPLQRALAIDLVSNALRLAVKGIDALLPYCREELIRFEASARGRLTTKTTTKRPSTDDECGAAEEEETESPSFAVQALQDLRAMPALLPAQSAQPTPPTQPLQPGKLVVENADGFDSDREFPHVRATMNVLLAFLGLAPEAQALFDAVRQDLATVPQT